MNDTHTKIWLPSTEQIIMSSELAILAALDANLVLAERSLMATHASQLIDIPTDEPRPPDLALAQSILTIADCLRELIASYNVVVDRMINDT